MPFLEFKNVDYSYLGGDNDYIPALKNVSFSVERGEFVALVGCNGSGKSTLARLSNGLLLPDEGEVSVDGKPTSDKKNLNEIRNKIGVVFQNPDNQMVASIVEDDIAFGPENLGLPREQIIERVEWALSAVGMSEYRKSGPLRLSGGQRQRVAIAGVLAIKPELMILDEATGMLDPAGRREVLDVVKKLNRDENMAIIMITHFMEEAASADRIIVLDRGRKSADGGAELFKTPEVFTSVGLDLPVGLRVARTLQEAGVDIGYPFTSEQFVSAVVARVKGEHDD